MWADSKFSVVSWVAPANLAKYFRESANKSKNSDMG